MKRFIVVTLVMSVFWGSPVLIAGVSLDVAPVEEWDLTSSSATFTIDFVGDPGECGLFYVQIQEEDPGVFMDISVDPAAGDMGHVLTSIMPMPASLSTTTTYYKTYEIHVEDSQGDLPGGLLAQLTFYQEGYGSSLIRAFKDPDYQSPVASVLIAIVDFPGGGIVPPGEDPDDIPIPGDGEDVPEPATLLMLGLGGWAILRKY